jgi:hypothetical protein
MQHKSDAFRISYVLEIFLWRGAWRVHLVYWDEWSPGIFIACGLRKIRTQYQAKHEAIHRYQSEQLLVDMRTFTRLSWCSSDLFAMLAYVHLAIEACDRDRARR